jgi:hypothetical protein
VLPRKPPVTLIALHKGNLFGLFKGFLWSDEVQLPAFARRLPQPLGASGRKVTGDVSLVIGRVPVDFAACLRHFRALCKLSRRNRQFLRSNEIKSRV